jgi:hypothetical protein
VAGHALTPALVSVLLVAADDVAHISLKRSCKNELIPDRVIAECLLNLAPTERLESNVWQCMAHLYPLPSDREKFQERLQELKKHSDQLDVLLAGMFSI